MPVSTSAIAPPGACPPGQVLLQPLQVGKGVVQAVPCVGMGRANAFARLTSEFLAARGAELPLGPQGHRDRGDRDGVRAAGQRRIVGAETVDALYANGPADQQHIQRWLSAQCFGDHYTRSGLDLRIRELITFILLAALGG